MTDDIDLTVKLVYKDNCPVFQNELDEGDKLLVHFGWQRSDNRDYDPTVCYVISFYNSEGKDKWLADCIGSMGLIIVEEYEAPKLMEMVDCINIAIENHQELDLTEYMRYWKQLDADFRTFVVKFDEYSKKRYSDIRINEQNRKFK